jgi:hypothetical protein
MARTGFSPWRALFILGAVLVSVGASMHPRGTMAQMLADPIWFRGHATAALGYLVLCAGLALYRRDAAPPERTRRWAGVAAVLMGLEALEMAVHAMAYVDAGAAAALGDHVTMAAPVLMVHLWMATIVYPLTGIAVAALIWTGMRERSLGSPWIGWLGILGALAHAAVMPLVFLMDMIQFGILFPMIMFLTIWFILAGVWPRRSASLAPAAGPAAREPVPGAV